MVRGSLRSQPLLFSTSDQPVSPTEISQPKPVAEVISQAEGWSWGLGLSNQLVECLLSMQEALG